MAYEVRFQVLTAASMKFTDVSEVIAASIVRALSDHHDDGGSKLL
jgi:hypothetical protein